MRKRIITLLVWGTWVCGGISAIFLIAILLNNTIDHNLDFKNVISFITIILSLVTICITVINYRKTSENTKRSIEIASLSTITNITKEYAARINETTLPLKSYGDIKLFLEKFTRLIDVINKRTDGIEDFKDICVPYFSMDIIKELTKMTSLGNVLRVGSNAHNTFIHYNPNSNPSSNEQSLQRLRSQNKDASLFLAEYHLICNALGLKYSKTASDGIKDAIEKYKLG